MVKYKITLSSEERIRLSEIAKNSKGCKMLKKRCLLLLSCEENVLETPLSNSDISKLHQCSVSTVEKLRKKFVEEGLESCLFEDRRGGKRYQKFDGRVEAHLIALRCSEPPLGYSQWTLRLLADKMVELKYVEEMGKDSVDRILKKTKLSHGK